MDTLIFNAPKRSILVPTDFSPGSDEAFRHALRMALIWKVPLTLAHAETNNTQVLPHTFPNPATALQRWGISEADQVPIRHSQRAAASVVQAMEQELDESPPDLIVMGHHHRSGLDWLLRLPIPLLSVLIPRR
jgi:nucleotide-binding universal stress UspA family protein